MNNVKEMQEKDKITEREKSIVHKQTGNGAQKLQTDFRH